MVDLQKVAARVAQAHAEHELAQKLAEIQRTATIAELDAAIDSLKAVMVTYNITYFHVEAQIPTYRGSEWRMVKSVYFNATYTGENIVTRETKEESVADFLHLLKVAKIFAENLTEDQVVQLWLGESLRGEEITLRGKLGFKPTIKVT